VSRSGKDDETAPTQAPDDALASGQTLAQGSAPENPGKQPSKGDAPIVRPGRRAGSLTGEQDWAPGTRVGRYVVLARIGKGGMGTVYRAEDVDLGRAVALKRLHATASADSRARLVREARTAAQLQHPNVLTVHEVAEHEGMPFLAMELVEGVTLTEWLKSQRTWREIVAMLAQAGRGLAAAHERGLVHRDFKPDNVLVDRIGRARVADFGLARAGGDHSDDTGARPAVRDERLARLTETGALAGTPAYMAPELVAGEPPDARCDQYAFAVTLHEALHGQHPFAGTTADALWSEMAAERVRPGKRTIPSQLERDVRRGLAADPTKRWPSVAAFVDAITPAVGWSRRRKLAVAGGGVAAAAALAITGVMFGGGSQQQQPCEQVVRAYRIAVAHEDLVRAVPDPADLARVDAQITSFEREAKAQLVDSCLDTRAGRQTPQLAEKRAACIERARTRMWSVLDRIRTTARTGAALAAALDGVPDLPRCADLAWVSRPAGPALNTADQQTLLRAEGQLEEAAALRDKGDLAGADDMLDAIDSIADKLGDHTLTTRTWLLRTELARDRGDVATAQTNATQAVAEAGLSGDPQLGVLAQVAMLSSMASNNPRGVDGLASLKDKEEGLDTATLHVAYGDALMARGRFSDGEAQYRAAIAMRNKLLPPAHLDRALAIQRLGAALIVQKRAADARPLLEEAAAAIEKALPPLRREAIEGVRFLAMVEEEEGHLAKALELHRDVFVRRAKVLGPAHPLVLDARADVARTLADLGDYANAVTELQAVVEGQLAAMGERSVNLADTRVSLANALISSGRFAEADAALAAAMPVLVRAKGADSPYTLVAEYAQTRSWLERPRPVKLADATRALDRIEPVFIKLFGESSQPAAAVATTRARAELAAGHADRADELATRAVAMFGDHKRADRAETLSVHAAILWSAGNRDGARAAAERSIQDLEAAGPTHSGAVVAIRRWLNTPSAHPPLPPRRQD
jgi:eukaryotic-like serine/threonine-protein kinase